MSKDTLKKIASVVCAFTLAAQFAVMPVNAAYINEDHSIYMGGLSTLEDFTISTSAIGSENGGTIGLNSMEGDYILALDIVFDGKFPTGSTAKGVADSTYIYFGGAKVGSHLMVKDSTADGFTLQWKSVSSESTTPLLSYGKKYHIDFKAKEIGTGKGASMGIYIYDDEGKLIHSIPSGGLRNFSSDNKTEKLTAANLMVFTTEGVESSVSISNVKLYREVGDQIITAVDGKVISDEEPNVYEVETSANTEIPVTSIVKTGTSNSPYKAVHALKAESGAIPKEITFKDNKIMVDIMLDGAGEDEEYKEYNLVLTASVEGYEDAKVKYPIVLKKGKEDVQKILEGYTVNVTDADGKTVADNSAISENIKLDAGNAKVKVVWESSDDSVIDSATGVVMPEAADKDITLTAKIYSPDVTTYFLDEITDEEELAAANEEIANGTAVAGKKVSYTYTVKGVKSIVDAAVAAIKFVSADNAEKVMNFDEAISEDFIVPVKYEDNESIKYTWESSDSAITIDDDTAAILQKTSDPAKTTLTGKVAFVKNNEVLCETTVEYPITVDVTADGTADKYIVRCDAAAPKNFSSLPEDGEMVRDDIDLPTKGIFGSTIKWTSSVPTSISNSGAVKKQSSAKKVNLTATITKGSAEKATYAIKGLVVPSKTGSSSTSSSGGSGGSGSSYNTNSTVSSTGNRASATEYKGTLTPNTSLQKGDVTTAEVSAFTDLSAAPWAKQAITHLYNKGIINGKTNAAFAPNDDITRAEFAKIVVKAFGLEDTSANVSQFSDVSPSDWYYTAVASAYNKGIIKGYEDGRFGVNDKITRQDMAVIIYRAAQVAGKTIAEVNSEIAFADSADIAAYATDAVKTLQKGGVINGMTATTFAPSQTATRAQAAQMIYGIVK